MKKYLHYIIIIGVLVLACGSDNDQDRANSIEVEVLNVTDNGATLTWTVPSSLQSGASVVYKIVLFGEVVADNLTSRVYTFSGLSDNILYTGSVFALDSNGNETFTEFSFTTIANPVFEGELTLSSQDDVDSFYYTWVTALIIDGEDITDLSNLQSLEYVERYIEIKNTAVTSLQGLENVQTDEDLYPNLPYLEIENNILLEDVSAIGGFSSKSINIVLQDSPLLTSLDGMELVDEPRVSLKNLGLTDLLHFSENTIIGLDIDGLNQLSNLSGLENIQQFSSPLFIRNCSNLSSLSGLGEIEYIYGLWLTNNDLLTTLDGLSFANQGGEIQVMILGNDNLTDFCSIQSWVENNEIHTIYSSWGGTILQYYFNIDGNEYDPTLEQMRSSNTCAQ